MGVAGIAGLVVVGLILLGFVISLIMWAIHSFKKDDSSIWTRQSFRKKENGIKENEQAGVNFLVPAPVDDVLEVVKKRLAEGEISVEEFGEIAKALTE